MVRYDRKVLKIREQSPFGPKFIVEFVTVFQQDLGWPTVQQCSSAGIIIVAFDTKDFFNSKLPFFVFYLVKLKYKRRMNGKGGLKIRIKLKINLFDSG